MGRQTGRQAVVSTDGRAVVVVGREEEKTGHEKTERDNGGPGPTRRQGETNDTRYIYYQQPAWR